MQNYDNYEMFLEIIMPSIDRKFENQKEYLSCSKGCALCCKNVSMPFSEIEFNYLIEGFNALDKTVKDTVIKNIKNIVQEKCEPVCPFLINEVCSVYKYRGLICRMFGLLLINEENEYTIPFCVHKGLNYSKVFDEKTQKLSIDKINELKPSSDPIFYELSRSKIFGLQLVKDLKLEVGKSKPLIEWLKEFYKETSLE